METTATSSAACPHFTRANNQDVVTTNIEPVSVFVCGVQKGGTTSLFAHFCEHPALSAPSRKELHFFDDEARDWSSPDYSLLDAFFSPNDGARLRFEITPIYSFWPPSIGRIRTYNSSARLIFLFRDPFDRAWSQWCMEYARGQEQLPFSEAIREGRRRITNALPLGPEQRIFSYVERGFYTQQVRRVLEHFPRTQVLFLRSQDLLDHHPDTLTRIAEFLGIPRFPETGPKREHPRPDIQLPSKVTDDDLAYFAALVRDEICTFAQLTGIDVTDWRTMRGV